MKGATAGIHHITGIAGDPQKNLDFYSGVLGLRLVKKTVNYDDPETYHFYFGDRVGAPGSILTFFPWTASGLRGRAGAGQVTGVAFSVPRGSLGFWQRRFEHFRIEQEAPTTSRDETQIGFHDPDGLALELVDSGDTVSEGAWSRVVPAEAAIRGFHSATLTVENAQATTDFLGSVLGLSVVRELSNCIRLATRSGGTGSEVDVEGAPAAPRARTGVGALHHIAWRARDDEEQRVFRERIMETGTPATPVVDRRYFRSVYFHEPGGILFEMATDPPGFSRDEPEESLGTALKLPPWLETLRPGLERALPVVSADRSDEWRQMSSQAG
ncbi:MAG TPA: ring-cleaving dioxygenase [Spirochaetia bacterium]|nr:ring-cleaving dioxygenase [Spirochaetia bacterium]